MPKDQSRTFQTAGDLKRELQNIPDDAPLSFGTEQSSSMGVSLQRSGTSVIFGVGGQQGATGQQARQQT